MPQQVATRVTWQQIARFAEKFLATWDIAYINLACADGLPSAPRANDIAECLRKLDEWAAFVRRYTELSYEQFFRTDPAKYEHSEALFRSICLVTALQRHCGLRYNPAKIPEDVPLETADTFIHGAILGAGGTCASIPVVLAAVGRRLGYPIKIAETKNAKSGHLFARWDDPSGERLNLEATCTGLGTPDDDHYRTGRHETTAEIEEAGQLLKSMSPRQELASFLAERGQHWRHHGRIRFTVEAFAYASGLIPRNGIYWNTLKADMNKWLDELEKRRPPDFPALSIQAHRMLPPGIQGPGGLPHERHFPPSLPLEMEQEILAREAMEDILRNPQFDRNYWEPMRRGVRLPHMPVRILAQLKPEGWQVRMELS